MPDRESAFMLVAELGLVGVVIGKYSSFLRIIIPVWRIAIRQCQLLHFHASEAKQHLALGEIGRRKDLSLHAHIENFIIESFPFPFEEIKFAASYALRKIAVANLSKYFWCILDQIDNQRKKQYLLLHSLKEIIVGQSMEEAEFQDSSVDKILNFLFNHCESDEEGVRNVIAECLGKLAFMEPAKLIPALKMKKLVV